MSHSAHPGHPGRGPRTARARAVELAPTTGTALTLAADAVMPTDPVLRGGADDLPVVDAVGGQAALDNCDVLSSDWTALLSRGNSSLAMHGCRIGNPAGVGAVE